MPLQSHVAYRVELAEILANAAGLHIRTSQYQADRETYQSLADYPIPEDLVIEYAEKQQYFEVQLNSILDDLVSKYEETQLSTLEHFYIPADAEEVENYGQELIDWTSGTRKNLIQLKAETAKMIREKEKDSKITKEWLISEFLTYEQRLRNIYHSIIKFEYWLKIKYKPGPALLPLSNPGQDLVPSSHSGVQVIPDTGRISPNTNDDISLTERLDKIRNTITTFQASRPEFSSRLCEIHQKYQLKSLKSSFSSQYSNSIFEAVNSIISEFLPHLLSAAKSEYQQVLADNEQAFHDYLEQKLKSSFGLIQAVLAVTNAAALVSLPEEGEIIE